MYKCDFCGKDQTKVKRMIISKHGAICNECVFVCVEVLMNDISEFKEINFETGEEINKNEIKEEK